MHENKPRTTILWRTQPNLQELVLHFRHQVKRSTLRKGEVPQQVDQSGETNQSQPDIWKRMGVLHFAYKAHLVDRLEIILYTIKRYLVKERWVGNYYGLTSVSCKRTEESFGFYWEAIQL